MASMLDTFTLIGGEGLDHEGTVGKDFEENSSAKSVSPVVFLTASVRHHNPLMTVSLSSAGNVPMLAFAAAGYATAELDTSEDPVLRLRGFLPPTSHEDPGHLVDATIFARYKYTWNGLQFTLYCVNIGMTVLQFLLFPPDDDENVMSNSKATDALLLDIGQKFYGPYKDSLYVFDGYWAQSSALYDEVQKISWDDVILNQEMKDAVSKTIEEFFNNEQKYRDLDVPWKRGIIFYGPPGNGKTISLKALMHSLSIHRKDVTLLYVRNIGGLYGLGSVFSFARYQAPCLLIIEDIDTQITPDMRSYFFNEVDGLENNDGIMMIATTNHLDRLDEGLKRPSRFDRRYLFPLPSYDERIQYCEFWRKKLEKNKAKVDFPKPLSREIAKITNEFSFATMKEAFVATLLAMARSDEEDAKRDKDLDNLPLWREMQKQVALLRKEMGKKTSVLNKPQRLYGDAPRPLPDFKTLNDRSSLLSAYKPPPVVPIRTQPHRPSLGSKPLHQPIPSDIHSLLPQPSLPPLGFPQNLTCAFIDPQCPPSLASIVNTPIATAPSGPVSIPSNPPMWSPQAFPADFAAIPGPLATQSRKQYVAAHYEDPWANGCDDDDNW